MPISLSGNALKLIAAAAMFIDHMGLMLFPHNLTFRLIGRLAFPIYAFMIAEGCKYTRDRKRYFLSLFLLGLACQVVYFVVDGSLYLSILFTFSLSILVIYALNDLKENPCLSAGMRLGAALGGALLLNQVFSIDYGFAGCLVPVFASLLHKTKHDTIPNNVAMLGLGLVLLAAESGAAQYFSLLALPLLLLYSGKRGKLRMKSFFYIFYPAHLAFLQLVAWLMA